MWYLDFEDTRFMDSSGIGIIIGRYKLISCFGEKVYVLHPDKQIRRMLQLSGVEKNSGNHGMKKRKLHFAFAVEAEWRKNE